MLPKIRMAAKKASNKNFSDLNFAKKISRAHMSITSQRLARRLERLILSKYDIVLKLKITLNLKLNVAKSIIHKRHSDKNRNTL